MKALNVLLVGILFAFLSTSNAEEKDGSTPSDVKLESLREIAEKAGYDVKNLLDSTDSEGFQEFIRFGSASTGEKFKAGDAFDKIGIKKETTKHRDSMLKRRFVLDKLEFKSNFEDVETKGLLAEVALPFRIVHEKKYERFTSTGVLSGRPHPLDATNAYSFLTKDGKLQRCVGEREVFQVRNSNGVLYRAESTNSVLVLVLKGDIGALKQIARNPEDYSISIELTGLRSAPPDTWGFYKETALAKENWDSEWLRYFWPPLLEDKQPNYFVTAHKSDNNDRIPEIAMATMVSLAVMDNKKGEVIGGYNIKSSGLIKDLTKAIPTATTKAKEAQKEVAKSLQREVEEKADFGDGVNLEMVLIPAGKFIMGSPEFEKSRSDNETQHEVTLTKPFYMGKYEVTQEQWESVMGKYNETPGKKLPVTDVSWNDCQSFIKKLNAKTNGDYRLPTEAEWEYACRAGTTTAYSFGDKFTPEDVNNDPPKINKHKDEDGVMIVVKTYKPNSVGAYKPNAFGLYDMHGNVCEWCEDVFGDYPRGPLTDPRGPLKGANHVVRGGSVSVSSRNVVVEGGESEFHKDIRFFPGKSSTRFGLANPVPNVIGLRLAKTADLKAGASLTVPKPDPAGVKPAPAKLEVTKVVATIEKELMLIPAGKFMMGSPMYEKGRNENEKQHEVSLTKPFYMGKYEVTQEQYESVMGNNPSSKTKGAKLPVTDVSWNDCQEFIKKLNTKTNGGYRLPTEAEWEYACRAGTTTTYSYGDAITSKYLNFKDSGTGKPVAVGTFQPNAFGLHDMHGNVWEWCEDWYGEYPIGSLIDQKGPGTGTYHVLRGGSFCDDVSKVRSSNRFYNSPSTQLNDFGFRLAKTQ